MKMNKRLMAARHKLDNVTRINEQATPINTARPLNQQESRLFAMNNILREQQGQQRLTEFDWGALGKGLGSMAMNLNPYGQMYNMANDLYTGGKNIAGGQSWKDAGGEFLNKNLDRTQQGLDVAGMIPGLGAIPDLVNVGVSGARGGVATAMGNKQAAKDHYGNMALSSAAAIPGAGLAAGAGKIGKTAVKLGKTAKYGGKATKQGIKSQQPKVNYAGTGGLATDAYNKIKSWW
jgi:hypothetical protein